MTEDIAIMENILVLEKEFIEGHGDIETFESLIKVTSNSTIPQPSFPLKMSEIEYLDFNKKRHIIVASILNFQNGKSKDNKESAIVELEQGLMDYKKAFDVWLERENKCPEDVGFCRN